MRHPWMTMLGAAALVTVATVAGAGGFQIVVHPSVDGSKISRSVLAGIYQKEMIRWGDQSRIHPVDQSSHAPVRQAFNQEILGRSLGEVQSYWTQRMAVDREIPPPTKASDEAVLEFVAGKKGAIGYVSGGIDLPPGVKLLAVIN